MLEYGEGTETCIARIISDLVEKKIFIAINGRKPTRRCFLSIIRDKFKTIHNSFANLEVSEWVPVPGYPGAKPLDYENLLGLEEMGKSTHTIGKPKVELNLRQLLDGYESKEDRDKNREGDSKYHRIENQNNYYGDIKNVDRSNTTHQHGQRDNFGGDGVQGDKIMGNANETP